MLMFFNWAEVMSDHWAEVMSVRLVPIHVAK